MNYYTLNWPDNYMRGLIITGREPYQLEFVPASSRQTKILPVSDFPRVFCDYYTLLNLPTENPVFSERAFQLLKALIPGQKAKVLTLHYEGHNFFMLEPPVVKPDPWMPLEEYVRTQTVQHHVFVYNRPGTMPIFSEIFCKAIKQNKLIGAAFTPISG